MWPGRVSSPASDPENQGNLLFSILDDADFGDLQIVNAVNGDFSYDPDPSQTGVDTAILRITDSTGLTTDATIYLNTSKRVMPLGDSITEGVTCATPDCIGEPDPQQPFRIGYRMELERLMESAGYSIDFVGSKNVAQLDSINANGGYGYTLFDDFHSEGHGGEKAQYFDNNTISAATWLTPADPDIVLLHIGTNDFETLTPVPSVTPVIDTVNNILSADANTRVFVARLIGQHPDNPDGITAANVNTFNNNVVAALPGSSRVFPVDMFSGFDYTTTGLSNPDFGDTNKHPSQSAYNEMASRWATALMASGNLVACP